MQKLFLFAIILCINQNVLCYNMRSSYCPIVEPMQGFEWNKVREEIFVKLLIVCKYY